MSFKICISTIYNITMKTRPKSDYRQAVINHNGKKVVLIEDMNLGNMSVTNDIENIVTEICKEYHLSSQDCIFLYWDSEDIWDGWDAVKEQFIYLGSQTWQEAIRKYPK